MLIHYCKKDIHNNIYTALIISGVGKMKPWGIMHKHVFKKTTKDILNDKLDPKPKFLLPIYNNPQVHNNRELEEELFELKKELDGLREFLKHYVVNIGWLEDNQGCFCCS